MTTDLIELVECRLVNIPLERPFIFASNKLASLPYAWCRIETSDGVVGYGEAPTYWDPTGETQFAAAGAIDLWTPVLVGSNPMAWRAIVAQIASIARGGYAARCAVETAILDIASQRMAVPAYALLGGPQSAIVVNAVVPLNDATLSEIKDFIAVKVDAGYTTMKIKSSARSAKRDNDVVEATRDALPDATVFVDANQSWRDGPAPLRRLAELAHRGLAWVEQPLAAGDVVGNLDLMRRSPVPVMLDESVTDAQSLGPWVDGGLANAHINIKLAKAGGPFSALAQVDLAEALHVRYSVGSMIESGLGMLANYHFARSVRALTCGFDVYDLVDDGLDVGLLQNGSAMYRQSDEVPGLGYETAVLDHFFYSQIALP